MKTPLVLIHGWGVNSKIWAPIEPELETQFDLTHINLPGYGGQKAIASYSLNDVAEKVIEQAPQNATWVGWSLGATIAMRAALVAPERIDSLVLVAPTPMFVATSDWEFGVKPSQSDKILEGFESNYGSGLKKFLLRQFSSPRIAKNYVTNCLVEVERLPRPSFDTLRNSLSLLTTTDLRSAVRDIETHVQIVVGKNDHVIPAKAGHWLSQNLPTASLTILESGHLPFWECPDSFLKCISPMAGALGE